MLQPNLFHSAGPRSGPDTAQSKPLDVPGLLDRLTATCERPRYNFMLLTLIAEASAMTGRAGPYVSDSKGRVPIRDWLCDAMSPVGRRQPRRLAMVNRVREELSTSGALPEDQAEAEVAIDAEVRARLRQSGRTNVSRAVSELVRAGLIERYYQGDYVDHHNRGGQRQAVYTITAETRRALAQASGVERVRHSHSR